MNKSGNKIIKRNKLNNSLKKGIQKKLSPVKNLKLSSKNMYPQDSSYISDKNPNNSFNDENVIANILKTNNVNDNLSNKQEVENKKVMKIAAMHLIISIF